MDNRAFMNELIAHTHTHTGFHKIFIYKSRREFKHQA